MSLLVSGVFDIECEGWDTYVVGGCWDGREYHRFRDAFSLVSYMRERGGVWWGHYAGAYDMLSLLDEHVRQCSDEKIRFAMAGSRIVAAKYPGGFILRDSYALAPVKLKKFAKIAGLEKTEPALVCRCGEKCGGFCSIRRKMPEPLYRLVEEYLENDCKILMAALLEWFSFLRARFGEPKGTIGATSYAFSRQGKAAFDSRVHSFLANGYYGGRNEVFRQCSPSGWHEDINSAYVHALTLPMPVGPFKESYTTIPKGAKFWIAEAIVKVPESEHIPPLPVRVKGRSYYPRGEISGVWTSEELNALPAGWLQQIGFNISWEAADHPYRDYCERVWKYRSEAGKESVKGNLLKRLGVSLAGKLAQRPEVREVVYSRDMDEMSRLGYRPIGRSIHFWEREKYKIADCAHIHHAAFMTAHVRLNVWGRGRKANRSAVYTDTDSLFSEADNRDRLGYELGEWGRKCADHYQERDDCTCEWGGRGKYKDLDVQAPKLYRYFEAGEWATQAKGFGRTEPRFAAQESADQLYEQIAEGKTITIDRGVYPLLRAIRLRQELKGDRHVFIRRHDTRTHHPSANWIGGRLRDGEVLTRPPTMKDIAEVLR